MLNILSVAPAGSQGLYFYSETAEYHQTLYHLDTNNVLRRIAGTDCNSLGASFRKVVASFNGNCFYAVNWSMMSGQYAGMSYYSPVTGSGWNITFPSIYPGTIAQFVEDIARLPNERALALCAHRLYVIDSTGVISDSLPFRGPGSLLGLSGGDFLICTDSITGRSDLTGNFAWTLPDSGRFVERNGTVYFFSGGTYSVLDISSGNLSPAINIPAATSFDPAYDGGWFISRNDTIERFDNSGTLLWSRKIQPAIFPVNAFALPDGGCITGGTYRSYACFQSASIEYSAFMGTLDSLGNGPLHEVSAVLRGDVNNDGFALPEDILYIGVADGQMTNDFFLQDSLIVPPYFGTRILDQDWQQTFPNGINYKYADTNGDNAIDSTDLYINPVYICMNPPFQSLTTFTCDSTVPTFRFIPANDSAYQGSTLRFYVTAGSPMLPVDSLFGFSIGGKMPGQSAFGGFQFYIVDTAVAQSSPLGNPGNLRLYTHDSYVKFFHFTIMRKDHLNGYQFQGDTVAYIDLYIDTSFTADTLIQLEFTSVLALMADGTEIPSSVCTEPFFYIASNTSDVGELYEELIHVYPNPADETITFSKQDDRRVEISVYSLLGEKLKTIFLEGDHLLYDISDLAAGVYYISAADDKKASTFPLIVQ